VIERAGTRVLLAEDEEHLSSVLEQFLHARGYDVMTCRDGRTTFEAMQAIAFDVALIDIVMPEMDGVELLRRAKVGTIVPEVIVLTSAATIDTALTALKLGAFDYLAKPYRMAEVDLLISRALEHRDLVRDNTLRRQSVRDGEVPPCIVTRHPAMQEIVASIGRLATLDHPVLLTGERGTGKKLLARHVHGAGTPKGRSAAFVRADRPSSYGIESDLFGHKANTLPGVGESRAGAAELASNGTLVIQEVGALDRAMQTRLLAAIEDRSFTRAGGRQRVDFRARMVATTSQDLRAAVAVGRFLEPLLNHLSQATVALPPLRDRLVDLHPLLTHFLSTFSHPQPPTVMEDALEALAKYRWPGNVAELETVAAHFALVVRGRTVRATDLPLMIAGAPMPGRQPSMPLAELEREHIEAVLKQTRWHQGRAAAALGISSKTLYRKIREYGFQRPQHS
jgi:DNA-binding NtrC family response regulator